MRASKQANVRASERVQEPEREQASYYKLESMTASEQVIENESEQASKRPQK